MIQNDWNLSEWLKCDQVVFTHAGLSRHSAFVLSKGCCVSELRTCIFLAGHSARSLTPQSLTLLFTKSFFCGSPPPNHCQTNASRWIDSLLRTQTPQRFGLAFEMPAGNPDHLRRRSKISQSGKNCGHTVPAISVSTPFAEVTGTTLPAQRAWRNQGRSCASWGLARWNRLVEYLDHQNSLTGRGKRAICAGTCGLWEWIHWSGRCRRTSGLTRPKECVLDLIAPASSRPRKAPSPAQRCGPTGFRVIPNRCGCFLNSFTRLSKRRGLFQSALRQAGRFFFLFVLSTGACRCDRPGWNRSKTHGKRKKQN